MPICIQLTLSISIIKLGDWVAGLHFVKEHSGEKIERKLFECVSKVYNSFSEVCRNRSIRNDFSLRKEVKSVFKEFIPWRSTITAHGVIAILTGRHSWNGN